MTARFDVRVQVEVEDQAAADRLERVLGDALAGLLQFRPAVEITSSPQTGWTT